MMMLPLDGLIWLLLLLWPFLMLQRGLHREVQAVFLLLTRRMEISIALFSLVFLPGVFLHEFSHFLMARLLGVEVRGFSLLPRPMDDGRLQLGFVETGKTDVVRDALVGVAPLLSGSVFVALVGLHRLGFGGLGAALSAGDGTTFFAGLAALPSLADFWLWFYLAFAVSSTMLPSASDRRAWLPLAIGVVLLLALGLFAGAGEWLLANLAPPLNEALRALAIAWGISVALHMLLLPPFWALRRALSRLTGQEVVG